MPTDAHKDTGDNRPDSGALSAASAWNPALIGLLVVTMTLAAGCAIAPPSAEAENITGEMLLAAEPFGDVGTASTLPETEILALSPEMLAFLDRHVDANKTDYAKLRSLIFAIMEQENFRLEYEEKTRTAAETFSLQSGNCLSFTNMFIAMAREVGLDARFQEVDIPPDWTAAGGAFVLNRHVNVFIRIPAVGNRVVDFNIDEFQTSYDRWEVPDSRAIAHYYNNIAVERMLSGETASALQFFRKAIDNDREFGHAWSNLGTLYRHGGFMDYAEAAYLRALAINGGDMIAKSNLAAVYDLRGDTDRAAEYRQRVAAHRMRNPYYRYRLAREAYLAGQHEKSIDHLKVALRKKKDEDAFYALMGLNHLKKGNEAAARRWLERAKEIVEDEDLERAYNSKLEILLSSQD